MTTFSGNSKYGVGTPPATENGTPYIASGSQSLRIWKKQSNESRTFSDFIPPTVENDPDSYYTPASLLGGGYEGTFYVESLCPADNYKADITVTIVPIEIRNGIVDPLPTEDTIPETYNLSDKVGFSTLNIDLDIDSDNNAWTSWSPDDTEDSVEDSTDQPGKIMFTNEGCESNAQRPDYANLAERSGETNLVPMRLSMNTSLPLSNFKIKFEYQGESQLPDFASAPMAITGDAIKNIPFTSGKTYKDYTVLKKGILRVWAGVASHTAARKANKFGTKSDSSLTDPDGNYLAPTSGVDDAYPAELLFNGQSGPNYSINLWVEGINPSDATRVKATLLHQPSQGGTWNETIADAVKIKVVEGNLAVNVNNDPEFELDENDDKLEDQNDGFVCWEDDEWTTMMGTNDSDGLENLFASKVKIPRDLYDSGWSFYIQLTGNTLVVYDNVEANAGGDRLAHLKSLSKAMPQINADYFYVSTIKDDIVLPAGRDVMEYLFQVNNESVFTMKVLAKSPNCSDLINVDTCKITAKDLDKMFMCGSMRGTPSVAYNYPIDDNNTESINAYPDFQLDTGFAANDPSKDKYFIFIHGYNVDTGDAVDWNRAVFRRMYWTGFRGNYIGLTWHGDEGQINGFELIDITPAFWSNVYNAMQSAYPVMRFFKDTVQGTWGASSSDITVMAHSLGNLVMWDSLRLFAKHYPNSKAVNSAVSVEAAVWKEAFDSEASVSYSSETQSANNITYSVSDLKTHSWAFWFSQSSYVAKGAANKSINSYLGFDDALLIMKLSDYLLKDHEYDLYSGSNHFNRDVVTAISPTNRTSEKLADDIPALLQPGHRTASYGANDLTNPMGMQSNSSFFNGGNIDSNSSSYGWGADTDDCHSDLVTMKYYNLYKWYEKIWSEIR